MGFSIKTSQDYFIYSILATVSDPDVDGTFTDDITGFPEEYEHGPQNINMSDADVAVIQYYTQLTNARLIDELVAFGKYNWQAFGHRDGIGPGVSQSGCASFMRARCSAEYQELAVTMQFNATTPQQSVAAFLITRPPIAYLGFGFESDMRQWHPIFLTQVGEPSGLCSQIKPGVYTYLVVR